MNGNANVPEGNSSPLKKRKFSLKKLAECPALPPSGVLLADPHLMELFQVSANTLRNWRKQGKLPSYKIGGKHSYKSEEILQLFRV